MKSRRLWVAVLGVLLIAFLGLVNARREVARAIILERARALDLPGLSLEVKSLGVAHATLANVHIDVQSDLPALEVSSIELRYSARSLLDRRFTRVDVEGLRGSARLRDGELDFGLFGPNKESDRGDTRDSEVILPFDEFNLEDSEITILLDDDELRLAAALHSRFASDSELELAIDIDLQSAQSDFAVRTRLRGGVDVDGVLHLAPVDCIAIEFPADWFENPFHLTPAQTLCLRGDPQSTLLMMRNPFDNPSDFELSLTLDPMRFGGRIGEGEGATPFEIELPLLRGRYAAKNSGANPMFRLTGAGGQFHLPDEMLSIEELAFDLALDRPFDSGERAVVPVGSFTLGRILDRAKPARFGPLVARGQIAVDRETGERLRIGVDLEDLAGLVKLRIDALHAPASNTGSLEFSLEPLILDRLEGRLSALFPTLAGEVSDLAGQLEFTGTSRWQSDELESELTLKLGDLAVTTGWGRLVGVQSTLTLQGPAPFYMAETQRVTIERIQAGIEIVDCLIDFRLRRDGVVEVPLVRWSFAGGIAQTHGFYDPRSEQHEFSISVSGVDLQTLLELLAIDGVSGEGTLSGEIPLRIHGDVIEVRQARLSSVSPGGWLRYRPGGASSIAAAQDDHLSQFTEMLENFHFTSIVITLNGSVLGDVETAIHLVGANPDFYDGFPAELNLNVQSKFWDLIQDGTAAFRLADRLADVVGRSMMSGQSSGQKQLPVADEKRVGEESIDEK